MSDGISIDLELEHDRTVLTKYARDRDELDSLRFYAFNAGDYRKIDFADGGWDTLDMSGSGNIYTLTPPDILSPMLEEKSYVVGSYDESQAYDGGESAQVTLELIRLEPREAETRTLLQETADSDQWLFDFNFDGSITPQQVTVADESNQRKYKFEMWLDQAQVELLLEVPNRLGATTIIEVPHGDDWGRDAHPNNRNTVNIQRPSNLNSEVFSPNGDYIVTSYKISSTESVFEWKATMEVVPSYGTI